MLFHKFKKQLDKNLVDKNKFSIKYLQQNVKKCKPFSHNLISKNLCKFIFYLISQNINKFIKQHLCYQDIKNNKLILIEKIL